VPRSRHLRLGSIAAPIALLVLLASSFPSRPLQPVGEVRGAVATPPGGPGAPPDLVVARVPRLVYFHSTDRNDPRTGEAFPARPSELTGYDWPLPHGRITLPFKAIPGGTRIKDGKLFHDGIDIASFCGDRVRAAHAGRVLATGRHFDDVIGWIGDLRPYYALLDKKQMWNDLPIVVVIDDGNGYRSIYAHLSKVTVKVGDTVRAGQGIGLEGRTGHASGCHVHYGLFSPLETATFGVRADLLRKLKLPTAEIARIDPILVMPDGPAALKARRVPAPALAPPASSPAAPIRLGGSAAR
jgi:murein DD-endopeptidase MepM/ murein hydrolase activator NlpD